MTVGCNRSGNGCGARKSYPSTLHYAPATTNYQTKSNKRKSTQINATKGRCHKFTSNDNNDTAENNDNNYNNDNDDNDNNDSGGRPTDLGGEAELLARGDVLGGQEVLEGATGAVVERNADWGRGGEEPRPNDAWLFHSLGKEGGRGA